MQRIHLLLLVALLLCLVACQDETPPTLMPTAVPPARAVTETSSQVSTATVSPTSPPTFTPTVTVTPSPSPTPTPLPHTLLDAARRDQAYGDYLSAIGNYRQVEIAPDTIEDEQRTALLGIGEMQLQLGGFADAEESLTSFLDRYPSAPEVATATFWLAQARQGQMDWDGSIAAFEAYLALDDTLTTYVSEMVADSYLALGNHAAAVMAYETALTGAAAADKIIAIRERLAQTYMAAGEVDTAMAQYDAIGAITDDNDILARIDYLSGYVLIISGLLDEGYARYLHAVNHYPTAYDSYLALVELVDLGYPVDDFQRGLVDYHAGAHIPAITAFYRHIEAAPYDHPADAHLYIARCYAALGNYPAALTELEVLLNTHQGEPLWGDAWLERAEIQLQSGDWGAAIQTYLALVDGYPAEDVAPMALWRAAALWERNEDWDKAYPLYRQLAADYPTREEAAEALLRAGLMALRAGDSETAVQDWKNLVDSYPASDWYAPALLWMMGTLAPGEAPAYEAMAAALPPDSYYAIRAADLVSGVLPFEPPASIVWPEDEMVWLSPAPAGSPKPAEQIEAETWLRGWVELDEGGSESDIALPSSVITADPRWERGRKLWELNLIQPARDDLNGLRYDLGLEPLTQDPLACYQLALAFREMGLYRSSILATHSLIHLSPVRTPLDLPPFIGRLAYPAYYRELVEASAAEYGLDPLFLLSMIWQESLFESFARSGAAAQGLLQVIPSTGEYIADLLEWPDYRNEELFKPVVSIPFGAYYIAEQFDAFDNKPYVALSAYNAGPGNASYWYELVPDDPDLYLETIAFSETRLYIQRIYTHYAAYRAFYGAP